MLGATVTQHTNTPSRAIFHDPDSINLEKGWHSEDCQETLSLQKYLTSSNDAKMTKSDHVGARNGSGDRASQISLPSRLLSPNRMLRVYNSRSVATGDKGPNTHWIHGENIEITVNMWLQYAQWPNAEYILNIPCYVTQICPVGAYWVHFECAQPSDSNVPSGQITGHIFNIHKNLTPICPVGKVWPYFQ